MQALRGHGSTSAKPVPAPHAGPSEDTVHVAWIETPGPRKEEEEVSLAEDLCFLSPTEKTSVFLNSSLYSSVPETIQWPPGSKGHFSEPVL